MVKAGIKAAEELANATGNPTERLVNIASSVGSYVDRGTELISSGEVASTFGKIAFNTTKDIICGDSVWTGFCLVSGTCEAVAICVMLFHSKNYSISRSNLCRRKNCKLRMHGLSKCLCR